VAPSVDEAAASATNFRGWRGIQALSASPLSYTVLIGASMKLEQLEKSSAANAEAPNQDAELLQGDFAARTREYLLKVRAEISPQAYFWDFLYLLYGSFPAIYSGAHFP
jgi:hypothetical protein